MTTALQPYIVEKRLNEHGREYQRIIIGDVQVTFSKRDWRDRRSYESKARVYGAIDALAPELDALEPTYIAYTDENSTDVQRVQEQMWRAWRDTTKRIVVERLSKLVDELQNVEGLTVPQDNTVKFSYKAGCSCGCSPGFILAQTVRLLDDKGLCSDNVDLHLSLVDENGDK